jgi:hypothetical protein
MSFHNLGHCKGNNSLWVSIQVMETFIYLSIHQPFCTFPHHCIIIYHCTLRRLVYKDVNSILWSFLNVILKC